MMVASVWAGISNAVLTAGNRAGIWTASALLSFASR